MVFMKLTPVSQIYYFGVMFDEKLAFTEHINDNTNKAWLTLQNFN